MMSVPEESASLFRAAFDSAPIGMALTSSQGIFIRTNGALTSMLGYDPGDLATKHFADITHPDDLTTSQEQLRRLVSGEIKLARWEKRYLHRNGHVIWAQVSVASVADQFGKLAYFVTQMEDITAQRKAEAFARASDELFRTAFESAASGMALVNPATGRFIRVNPAGCQMLGYNEEELMSLTIQDVTAPEDREESLARFRKVISGEEPWSRSALQYLRRDGSTAHSIVSTALVRDSDGHPLHLVANVVDISAQVDAQEELKNLLQSKDQLIASVSHELRTPLTAVLGFAELLRGGTVDLTPAERIEIIERIAYQTGDLTNIVEDLLVAARADNDTLTVIQVPVDLRAQAAQVLEGLGAEPALDRIRVTGGSVRGVGDPARVRQILRNLVSNALRYGGTEIELTTHTTESMACVSLVDNGVGVPEADRDRIFQPYQRAAAAKGLTASIGLGLTVSKKLAKLMLGDLTYRYENARSVFELAIPLLSTTGTGDKST